MVRVILSSILGRLKAFEFGCQVPFGTDQGSQRCILLLCSLADSEVTDLDPPLRSGLKDEDILQSRLVTSDI